MTSVETQICSNFSAASGASVNWTNVPPGCTLTPDPGSPWPFNAGPPIKFPAPSNPPAKIKEGLAPGAYRFLASCCPHPITVTVT